MVAPSAVVAAGAEVAYGTEVTSSAVVAFSTVDASGTVVTFDTVVASCNVSFFWHCGRCWITAVLQAMYCSASGSTAALQAGGTAALQETVF